MISIIAYDTIGNGIRVARGEMSGREMINVFISESFISVCALAGGSLLSTGLGPIGYLLGSLVGSIIGGITFQAGKKCFVSLCVESWFTLFGLVRQDYTLPESIISELGGDVFEPDTFQHSVFTPTPTQTQKTMTDRFVVDRFSPQTIEIRPLRRGVVSVSAVGYTF